MQKETGSTRKTNGKKAKKTTLTISIATCLFMCTMGYEISKSSPRKLLAASDQTQKPIVLYTNAPETQQLDDYQLKIKFLTTQAQLQSQKILDLKQEIQDLNEQLHELRLITFPRKETISKTMEMKKALQAKETELVQLQNDYSHARSYLLNIEKQNAKLAKQLLSQRKRNQSSLSLVQDFKDEIASLYDALGALIMNNNIKQQEQLKAYNELEAQTTMIQSLARRIEEQETKEKELQIQKKLNNSLNQSIQKQQLRLALNHLQNDYWKHFDHEHRKNLKQTLIETQESLYKEREAQQELNEELSFLSKLQESQSTALINLKQENQNKQAQISEMKELLAQKETSLTQLENDYQKIFDQLALTQEDMQSADRDVNIAKTQIKELDYVNIALKRQLEELKESLEENRLDLIHLSAYGDDITNAFFLKNKQTFEEAEKLQSEIDELKNALSVFQDELVMSENLLNIKEAASADSSNLIQQLQNDLKTNEKRVLDLAIVLENLQHSYTALETKKDLLDQLLVQHKSYSNQLENDFDLLKNEFNANSSELAKISELYQDTSNKLNTYEKEIAEKEKLFSLEKEQSATIIKELEHTNALAMTDQAQKEDHINKLQAQLNDLHVLHQEHQQSLTVKLKNAEQEISQLQSSLELKDHLLSEKNQELSMISEHWDELNQAHQAANSDHKFLSNAYQQALAEKEALLNSKSNLEEQHHNFFEELAFKEMLLEGAKKHLALNENRFDEKLRIIETLETALKSKEEELQASHDQYQSKEFNLLARQQILHEDLLKFKSKLSDLEYQISQKDNQSEPNTLSYEFLKQQFHTTVENFKSQLDEQKKINSALDEELQMAKEQIETEKKRVIEIQDELGALLRNFKSERADHEKIMRDLVAEIDVQSQTLQKIEKSRMELQEEFEKWKGVTEDAK